MGVSIVRNNEDLIKLKDTPCIAEELIPFENELAVIVSRNPNGELKPILLLKWNFIPKQIK